MKTEVIIWQGEAKIVLYAESEFEMDLIEKIKNSRDGYETKTKIITDYDSYSYSKHKNHRIQIELTENKLKNNKP